MGSFRGYGDRLRFLRFRDFGSVTVRDAVLEGGFDLVGVDAARHLERAAERAVAALGDVTVLSFLFLVFVLFALNRQHVVGQLKLDIPGVEAWQFRRDFESLVLLDDINGRRNA